MIRGGGVGNLITRAMQEAREKFGEPRHWNQDVVARWIQARVRELRDGPLPRDGKARQAGEA